MRAAALLVLVACGGEAEPTPWDPADPPRTNVVVVVLDDVGVDKVGAYGLHPDAPATPALDALAADGVLFRNAWAMPTCTPARVALVTGQHSASWGTHIWVAPDEDWQLPPEAFTVPDLLAAARPQDGAWDHSFAGKWHLTGFAAPDPAAHPVDHGWNWYAGSPGNLDKFIGVEERAAGHYFDWQKNTNGTLAWTQKYATTDTIDDAIARMDAMTEPWVLFVSLNASHVPWTAPPEVLASMPEHPTKPERHDAVVEAMDAELGRLFDAIPSSATTIVIGDNGTYQQAVEPPWDPSWSKNRLTEGGLRVPLIVSGPLVDQPGESDALVHILDVFATLGDNAGVDPTLLPSPVHGHSLLPLLEDLDHPGADVIFADRANENAPDPAGLCVAARDRRYKLIECKSGPDELYDLSGYPEEGPNLLDGALTKVARTHRKALAQALDGWREDAAYRGNR